MLRLAAAVAVLAFSSPPRPTLAAGMHATTVVSPGPGVLLWNDGHLAMLDGAAAIARAWPLDPKTLAAGPAGRPAAEPPQTMRGTYRRIGAPVHDGWILAKQTSDARVALWRADFDGNLAQCLPAGVAAPTPPAPGKGETFPGGEIFAGDDDVRFFEPGGARAPLLAGLAVRVHADQPGWQTALGLAAVDADGHVTRQPVVDERVPLGMPAAGLGTPDGFLIGERVGDPIAGGQYVGPEEIEVLAVGSDLHATVSDHWEIPKDPPQSFGSVATAMFWAAEGDDRWLVYGGNSQGTWAVKIGPDGRRAGDPVHLLRAVRAGGGAPVSQPPIGAGLDRGALRIWVNMPVELYEWKPSDPAPRSLARFPRGSEAWSAVLAGGAGWVEWARCGDCNPRYLTRVAP